MRDYTKIEAWKLADDLAVQIYSITKSFPREELYGLVSQVRRAAVSVASNIAEGSSRGTQRDYLHFLYMARGSLTETHYLVHLAQRLQLITGNAQAILQEQLNRSFACLHALVRAVEAEKWSPLERSGQKSDRKSHSPIVL